MKVNKLYFSIDITSNKETIWNALWNEENYPKWANVFFEGSYAVSDDWKQGSKVHFLGPDKNGIYSLIEEHISNKHIKFRHVATVVNGVEKAIDEESKVWTGATEEYSIIKGNGFNTLKVEIDVMDEHLDFMKKTFPKALEKIKENSEQ